MFRKLIPAFIFGLLSFFRRCRQRRKNLASPRTLATLPSELRKSIASPTRVMIRDSGITQLPVRDRVRRRSTPTDLRRPLRVLPIRRRTKAPAPRQSSIAQSQACSMRMASLCATKSNLISKVKHPTSAMARSMASFCHHVFQKLWASSPMMNGWRT